jgi:hypothetical protein
MLISLIYNNNKIIPGATTHGGLGLQSGRRRSAKLVPTFADRGVSRGQRNDSPRPGSATYLSGSSSIDPAGLTRLSGPRSRPTATQKNLAPGIEPGTSVTVARHADHQTTEAVNLQ